VDSCFFNGFIEKLEGKIPSFLMGMAYPHPFFFFTHVEMPHLSKAFFLEKFIKINFDVLNRYLIGKIDIDR
jgi:hypothetical protein